MHFKLYVASALCAATTAMAHIEMRSPYPLRSKFNPDNGGKPVDYDNKSPMSSDGSNFPCRGWHKDGGWQSVATYQAGGSYSITLDGSAVHAGGSCQISLSYDNGASFKVIKSMIGGCPLKPDWNFTVPSDVENGDALLAWSWFNLIGAREMYMNCAQVTIEGGSGTGNASLPDLFSANVGNGCSTAERKHTVFKYPGSQVEYGDGVTPNSPPFPLCGGNS